MHDLFRSSLSFLIAKCKCIISEMVDLLEIFLFLAIANGRQKSLGGLASLQKTYHILKIALCVAFKELSNQESRYPSREKSKALEGKCLEAAHSSYQIFSSSSILLLNLCNLKRSFFSPLFSLSHHSSRNFLSLEKYTDFHECQGYSY
jgi:hypothetical protein